MKVGNQDNFIILNPQLECDKSLASYGDALVEIQVASNGLYGKNQVWVSQTELESFSNALFELEKNRKGEAVLASISPGKLFIKVYAYDNLGHIAITGETSYVISDNVNFTHLIKFGFALESEYLAKLLKIKWKPKK